MSHVNEIIVPTLHLNGSSGDYLLLTTIDVGHAIRTLLDAMTAAEPNARDYYPQGDQAYNRARQEHVARLDVVRRLRLEYEQIAESIVDQLDARKR